MVLCDLKEACDRNRSHHSTWEYLTMWYSLVSFIETIVLARCGVQQAVLDRAPSFTPRCFALISLFSVAGSQTLH